MYKQLPKPFFVLAPMDDVTDSVFRQIIAGLYYRDDSWDTHEDVAQGDSEARNKTYSSYDEVSTGAGNAAIRLKPAGMAGSAGQRGKALGGPDLYFTEFVNVEGLTSPGRPKLLKKLRFSASETPLIAQLWGKTPEHYFEIAKQLVDGSLAAEANGKAGLNYAGIDINMGCPEKSIVNSGCCCGLINNRELAVEIIQAVKEAAKGKLPVSVKTRLGFNETDLSWHELLLNQGIDMLTIHARTRKEMSKVPAHWDEVAEIVKLRDKIAPRTLIVGNGDVLSRRHGDELADQTGVDGIMIGRGVFNDPFVFSDRSSWESTNKLDRINLYKKHVELFANTWKNGERPVPTLNKFCKVYISDFDGAKELREQLMACTTTEQLLALLDDAKSK